MSFAAGDAVWVRREGADGEGAAEKWTAVVREVREHDEGEKLCHVPVLDRFFCGIATFQHFWWSHVDRKKKL